MGRSHYFNHIVKIVQESNNGMHLSLSIALWSCFVRVKCYRFLNRTDSFNRLKPLFANALRSLSAYSTHHTNTHSIKCMLTEWMYLVVNVNYNCVAYNTQYVSMKELVEKQLRSKRDVWYSRTFRTNRSRSLDCLFPTYKKRTITFKGRIRVLKVFLEVVWALEKNSWRWKIQSHCNRSWVDFSWAENYIGTVLTTSRFYIHEYSPLLFVCCSVCGG